MKAIYTIIALCFSLIGATAQTNYYATTKTFYETGYTYQCDVLASGMVTLYNKSNQLTYVDLVYKATGKYYSPEVWEYIDTFEDDTWTKQLCHSIVNNAFSANEKARVKGKEFTITLYISPDTGKVIEVNFMFTTFNPYATIPVSVYRKIETELKSKIWFTITAEGKKLNYIMLFWGQEAK